MSLDDGVDTCQTKTATLLFGTEIRIEYPLEMFLRDTRSLVFYGYLYILTFFECNGIFCSDEYILTTHMDCSPLRHRLISIDYEVVDHLINLTLIDFKRPEVIGYIIQALYV
ncbi:hypothetical protein BMS3Abin08_00567 [bacterium BMS3Abin08]|nr:hypothetical protein BMS3Abin08_00567 [bacterium BMS3Abin08]